MKFIYFVLTYFVLKNFGVFDFLEEIQNLIDLFVYLSFFGLIDAKNFKRKFIEIGIVLLLNMDKKDENNKKQDYVIIGKK